MIKAVHQLRLGNDDECTNPRDKYNIITSTTSTSIVRDVQTIKLFERYNFKHRMINFNTNTSR